MNPATLAIPLTVLVLAALLCWAIILAKGKWWFKSIIMAAAIGCSFLVWTSIDSYMGWPTSQVITEPQQVLLHYGIVTEPNKVTGDPGSICLWVTKLTKIKQKKQEGSSFENPVSYKANGYDPRAHSFPYNREMHKALHKALQQINANEGRPMPMEMGPKGKGKGGGKGKGKGKGEGDGSKKGDGKHGGGNKNFSDGHTFYLHQLPPGKFIPKTR